MALGKTIGFSTRLTQNNFSLYDANYGLHGVHIALMGDPTLRMHPVGPASALLVASNGSGGMDLSWSASADTVLGYHVYSAPTLAGPFTRLTSNLVTQTTYSDPVVSSNGYMVRAVKLEVSASGSYYNASQGIFQSLDGSAGTPRIVLYQPTNNALVQAHSSVQLQADTFDPANSVTNVAFYANDAKIGEVSAPPYSLTWSNVTGGLYSMTAYAYSSVGPGASSSPVSIRVDNGGAPRLSITPKVGGAYAVTGDEVLGRVYRIQALDDFNQTNYQTLGSVTGNLSGTFEFEVSPAGNQRFYRTFYP